MLTPVQIKSLKKMNASKDAEKSKVRISEDFKAAKNESKLDIIELSGQTRSSFYRTFETGKASLKTILSIAQILDVSPYYYSGAEDEKGSYSEEALFNFLKEYDYHDLVVALKAAGTRKKRSLKKVADKQSEDTIDEGLNEELMEKELEPSADEIVIEAVAENTSDLIELDTLVSDSSKMQEAISAIDEESCVMLLKALFIRARAGGNAEMLSNTVKRCLLS